MNLERSIVLTPDAAAVPAVQPAAIPRAGDQVADPRPEARSGGGARDLVTAGDARA